MARCVSSVVWGLRCVLCSRAGHGWRPHCPALLRPHSSPCAQDPSPGPRGTGSGSAFGFAKPQAPSPAPGQLGSERRTCSVRLRGGGLGSPKEQGGVSLSSVLDPWPLAVLSCAPGSDCGPHLALRVVCTGRPRPRPFPWGRGFCLGLWRAVPAPRVLLWLRLLSPRNIARPRPTSVFPYVRCTWPRHLGFERRCPCGYGNPFFVRQSNHRFPRGSWFPSGLGRAPPPRAWLRPCVSSSRFRGSSEQTPWGCLQPVACPSHPLVLAGPVQTPGVPVCPALCWTRPPELCLVPVPHAVTPHWSRHPLPFLVRRLRLLSWAPPPSEPAKPHRLAATWGHCGSRVVACQGAPRCRGCSVPWGWWPVVLLHLLVAALHPEQGVLGCPCPVCGPWCCGCGWGPCLLQWKGDCILQLGAGWVPGAGRCPCPLRTQRWHQKALSSVSHVGLRGDGFTCRLPRELLLCRSWGCSQRRQGTRPPPVRAVLPGACVH